MFDQTQLICQYTNFGIFGKINLVFNFTYLLYQSMKIKNKTVRKMT